MKVVLPSTHTTFNFPFRIIGSAGRYDTLSDCAFLDDTHIVCADRQMATLYLVKVDISSNKFTVLDSQTCIVDGKPIHFDLLYVYKNKVFSVSYDNFFFMCDISNNTFQNFSITELNKEDAYHGLSAASTPDVLYFTNMKRPTIASYNLNTQEKATIRCHGVRLKDVSIIDEDHFVVLSSDNGPVTGTQLEDGKVHPNSKPYNSHALIYNKNTGKLLDTYVLKATQIDSCVFHNGYCYITCTNANGVGYILRCRITPGYKFAEPAMFPTEGFPHGIAIHNGLLAYTSYTDSSLTVLNLAEMVFV
jgi:hypothetical protein